MIGNSVLLGLIAVMSPQPTEAAPNAPGVVFACQYFKTDEEAGDGIPHVVDLRAIKHSEGGWTLEWDGRQPVSATPFEIDFGSVGGSLGLRWQDELGKDKKAYISFSDVIGPDKRQYFWLSVGKPSLWQTPGYGCESQGIPQ